MKKILTLLLMLFAMVLTACGGGDNSGEIQTNEESTSNDTVDKIDNKDKLVIKMLNVGQGDAILIQFKKKNTLIDTSDADEWQKVQNELEKAGITKIDKLILTHPHADHIGNARKIIEQYDVKEVYDDGISSTSPFYKSKSKNKKNAKGYVDYIEDYNEGKSKNQQIKLIHVKDGDSPISLSSSVKFNIFAPTDKTISASSQRGFNINNGSIVGKLVYKKFSMLFTGDAEKEVEKELLSSSHKSELKSTILKASHHGSKSSSTKDFLAEIKPKYVVISAGEPDVEGGNTYGHPHDIALNNYRNSNVEDKNIFWTYKNGTITITADGKSDDCEIEVENKERWLDEWLTSKANRKK